MREPSRHSASMIMSISLLRNGDRLAVRPAAPASQAPLLPWAWCLGGWIFLGASCNFALLSSHYPPLPCVPVCAVLIRMLCRYRQRSGIAHLPMGGLCKRRPGRIHIAADSPYIRSLHQGESARFCTLVHLYTWA